MIKIKNAMHSNLFFGTVIFMGFLLTWGCSKNVAPPEVEEPLAPVVEQIPEAQPEGDFTLEEVDKIEESGADFAGGGFDTSGPELIDEIDEVEVPPTTEPIQEFSLKEPVQEFGSEPVTEEVAEAAPPMNMQNDAFVAPEAEPLQEARVMQDFKDERQLQDVHFEYDRHVLDSQTKSILRANADWLKKNPNARVEIQGHADERGTNNYNLGLGERRALQTKKYMVTLGIDESRLYTISYGEEKPFCFESNENCWWENRRAHFTVAE
jgi:peptidoglycan-associated lipoprotein